MKKTLTFLLLSLFTLLLAHAQTSPTDKYQLLWEIKGPHSKLPSYLFGTMHVTDERAFRMPDSVLLGIQNTAGFALEVDFDSASYLFLEAMYAKHGAGMLDEETWTDEFQNTKSWDGEVKRDFDPGELFKLFGRDKAHEQEATFLDAFLFRVAREQGKTICGLEGIVEQLGLIAQPEGAINQKPKSSPAAAPRKRLRLNDMLEAYALGDLKTLDEMVNQGGTSEFFRNDVIIKRNHGMAMRADSLLKLRPTFIGIGAAHLPGDEGVIALLRQRGYRLRPVRATYTGLAEQARTQAYQPHWQSFARLTEGYELQVPTRPFPVEMMDGKFKMHLGMDFAGGMVFAFYALDLPGEMTDAQLASIGKSMVSTFGSSNVEDQAGTVVDFHGLRAREYRVTKDGEYLRIRLVFDNNKMYMLLLGNSKKVTDSPAADHWFNSLKIFEPVRVSRLPRVLLRDAVNGFSMQLPADYDYERNQTHGFPSGGEEPIYNEYEVVDAVHDQAIRILCEDFSDPVEAGKLEDRMPDCIRYVSGDEMDPVAPYSPIVTDGIAGLAATYENSELRYRLRCYMRYNRLYIVAVEMGLEDADSMVMDTVLDSFHLLPVQAWKLDHEVIGDAGFKAKLPGKPEKWALSGLPPACTGRIDDIQVYHYHDPASSLNAVIKVGHVWEYYGGRKEQDDLAEAMDGKEPAPYQFVVDPENPPGYRLGLSRWSSTEESVAHQMVIYRTSRISANYVTTAALQLPADVDHKALIAAFEVGFVALPDSAPRSYGPKLDQILDDMQSPDETRAMLAQFALNDYHLVPSEYEKAVTQYKAVRDDESFGQDNQLLQMLLTTDDEAMFPIVQRLYASLPPESTHRAEILRMVLMRPWPGANAWALAELKADPSCLDHAPEFFNWTMYLADDSTGARLRSLNFLLDQPQYALDLAADAASVAYSEYWDYRPYHGKFSSILSQAIDLRPGVDGRLLHDNNIYRLLNYLADENASGWQLLAHRILALPDGYLPGTAFVALGELGEFPSASEQKHVLSIRESRLEALQWLLDAGMGDQMPAKYRKPDFLAEVALDLSLEDLPDKVELLEKRKVQYDDQQQWLYIYRIAFEGDRDWTLGFAGPIPMKGLPEDASFPMSGSEGDMYAPGSFERRVREWIGSEK